MKGIWLWLLAFLILSGVFALLALRHAHAQEVVRAPIIGKVAPDGTVALPEGVPVIVQGQEIDYASRLFQEARAAASEKRWGALVSLLLSALLAGLNWLLIRSKELRDKVKDFMPEIAIGMAVLGYVAVALASLPAGAHITDWWAVIWPAVKTGAAAVGLYTFFVKRILGFYLPKLRAKLFPPKGPVALDDATPTKP